MEESERVYDYLTRDILKKVEDLKYVTERFIDETTIKQEERMEFLDTVNELENALNQLIPVFKDNTDIHSDGTVQINRDEKLVDGILDILFLIEEMEESKEQIGDPDRLVYVQDIFELVDEIVSMYRFVVSEVK